MAQDPGHRYTAFEPQIPDIPSVVEFVSTTSFWEAARPWLSRRGIELYEKPPQENPAKFRRTWWTPSVSTPASLPFARCVIDAPNTQKVFDYMIKLACGQDSVGRDVMLKLVDKNSPEYSIFQCLMQQQDLCTDPSTFPCVLPPLAILDTPHQYSIVTMPTWGSPFYIEEFQTMREVLHFMKCLLQGLVFLHANRIAHRDIFEYNVVVNCYRLDRDMDRLSEDLVDHRRRPDVLYALMDYDQSIYLPQVTSLEHCRRPAQEAWAGADMYRPDDRFTAEQALKFLNDSAMDVPQDALEAPLELGMEYGAMFDSEVYWSRLPPGLRASWTDYRAPPLPRSFWILNWLIQIPIFRRVIVPGRRFLGI
ncbi:hypothetical protein BD310DRAFT_976387 [Dichomitus squalens]|uniref:Protein kinase domain-containing protein n=1 Tax=Dichomitus squalens TaxID=114155 RepID=A0A4Q9PY31_9APHY|nr:hypothetical protein BD310DRAFT_976387 [Dichomitus squalens]